MAVFSGGKSAFGQRFLDLSFQRGLIVLGDKYVICVLVPGNDGGGLCLSMESIPRDDCSLNIEF